MRVAFRDYSYTPAASRSDRWDCGVRALRIAAGCSYESAQRRLKAHGRVYGQGTYNHTMENAANEWGFTKCDTAAGGTGIASHPTLAQFIRAHPKGRYILRINTHFLALVDGVIHNWVDRVRVNADGPRSRVRRAWSKS